jgi:hypothetical protein
VLLVQPPNFELHLPKLVSGRVPSRLLAPMLADPCLTPGLELRGDNRPIESFYEVPADPSAPPGACLRARVISRFEFVATLFCVCHGERTIGNAD